MQIKSIQITRKESYQGKEVREFDAKICLVGGSSYPADINMKIPDEMLDPIMAIVAQAAARSLAGATEQFHADVQAMLAGPAIEQIALADQVEPA